MTPLYLLSTTEREAYFDATAAELKIPTQIIEKDYWVVWILERLFSLSELKEHITFKGGTSLSKVYGAIQRFSEDVDLSIDKVFFGFDKFNDPENAPSKKKQRAMLRELAFACSDYVQNKLVIMLRRAISEKLGTFDTWQLEIDTDDPDGQTLQFKYPSTVKEDAYIRPSVKIELGARAEHWPVSEHKIQSYVKLALKEKVDELDVLVKVLEAKRTFWEKATILHQYAHLPHDKKLPPRISRHYYDFCSLLNSETKADAMKDSELLDRVASHKNIYFASAWANYKAAQRGSLKLVPPPHILESLEKDFSLMQDMFFGAIPDWLTILKTISDFEIEFNQQNAI